MATDPIIPRPLLAYSRFDGQPVALTPSASEPNVYHLTTSSWCSCKGFQFRSKCRHVAPPADVIRCVCGGFHLTSEDRVRAHPAENPGLADGGKAHLQVLCASGEWPS